MKMEVLKNRPLAAAVATALVALAGMAGTAHAGQAPAPPRSAREAAPVDPTGVWVAVITEDWRWRMLVQKPGETTSVPLNDAGIKAAKEWDPARDAAAGEQCKAFGPGGVMRLPLRIRVSWADDQTLKVETEAGQQTRLFTVAPVARGAPIAVSPLEPGPANTPSLQGTTVARWNGSTLEAVTNSTTGGYLRRNGVPYSANALIREYWNVHTDYDVQYLSVTTVVRDPMYLRQDFLTGSSFRKVTDSDPKWAPFPCDKL
jgi:hypothetical protein